MSIACCYYWIKYKFNIPTLKLHVYGHAWTWNIEKKIEWANNCSHPLLPGGGRRRKFDLCATLFFRSPVEKSIFYLVTFWLGCLKNQNFSRAFCCKIYENDTFMKVLKKKTWISFFMNKIFNILHEICQNRYQKWVPNYSWLGVWYLSGDFQHGRNFLIFKNMQRLTAHLYSSQQFIDRLW